MRLTFSNLRCNPLNFRLYVFARFAAVVAMQCNAAGVISVDRAQSPQFLHQGCRQVLIAETERTGSSRLPASAELLLANAQKSDYNHRRTLARNVDKIDAKPRPESVRAHHIVAHADPEAERVTLVHAGRQSSSRDLE
jgi:hypothetical protein